MTPDAHLRTIKAVHTVIWAFFVLAIAAVWICGVIANLVGAAWAIGIVLVEVAVLAFNRGQCPLGGLAQRYTLDRTANFDIYLPAWLAARTKPIFGTLYVTGIVFTACRWATLTPVPGL
jgi:hypothetical protein